MFQHIVAGSLADAIEKSMIALNEYGSIHTRENQDRENEMKEIQIVIDIQEPLSEPFISKAMPCDLKVLIDYEYEFIDGTSDELGWKYTYHGLYSPYYDKVIDELNRNINTRRACIALGQGDINFTSDPPCLQLLMFNVVNKKLELTCVFRSNDGVKAFPMNIQAIAALQRKVGKELDLEIGPMHYIANNFHCYNSDFKLLEQYVNLFEKYKDKPNRRVYTYEQYLSAKEKK